MKRSCLLSLVFGLALLVPSMALAQPGPNHHRPAPAPHAVPGPAHHAGPAPAPHHRPVPAPPPVVVHPAPVPPPPPAPQVVMNHHDFERLIRSIDRAPFKADKLARVQSAAATNRFSSQQAKELLMHLNFDGDRVKAACSLYPSVVDAANWHIIYEALSYSTSHAQVRHCSR